MAKRIAQLTLLTVSVLALSACVSHNIRDARAEVDALAAVAPQVSLPTGNAIGLKQFAQTIAAADESVRAQALDVEIARQENLGAAAMFEPEFYAEVNRLNEYRQVSAQEYRASGSSSQTGAPDPYKSDSQTGKLGVKMSTTLGATVDLFYEMDAIANSLQVPAALPSPEYTGRSGARLTVPLLRGRGAEVNTADIRIAGIDESIAKASTRLVQAKRVYEGVRTYLLYQRAAKHVALRSDILAKTERLAIEVERQVTSGLRSPGDLTEARAQVAERKASLTAAMQDRDEQLAAIQIFFAAINGAAARTFVPAEGLSAAGGEAFALDSLDAIMARRSEVAVQALEIEKTEVQTLLAEDATRAQLNLNLEASKNRLEADYVPFRQLFGANNPYQSWRVGFEYRRGLNGGQKAKAELKSALLREKQAELTMSALRQRLAAEVNSTGSILIQAKRALAEQSQLVDQKRKMVAEETAREQAGLSTAVERISREIELCLALEAAADALAQLQMANNLSAHVAGKLLSAYDIK